MVSGTSMAKTRLPFAAASNTHWLVATNFRTYGGSPVDFSLNGLYDWGTEEDQPAGWFLSKANRQRLRIRLYRRGDELGPPTRNCCVSTWGRSSSIAKIIHRCQAHPQFQVQSGRIHFDPAVEQPARRRGFRYVLPRLSHQHPNFPLAKNRDLPGIPSAQFGSPQPARRNLLR